MHYYRDLTYNPDYDWFETTISFYEEAVTLFVSPAQARDFPAFHPVLKRNMTWLAENLDMVKRYCLVRLLGFVPEPDSALYDNLRFVSVRIAPTDGQELLFRFEKSVKCSFISVIVSPDFELTTSAMA